MKKGHMIRDCRRRIANETTRDNQSQLHNGFAHQQQHGYGLQLQQYGYGQDPPPQGYLQHPVHGSVQLQPGREISDPQMLNGGVLDGNMYIGLHNGQDPGMNGQWQGGLADQAGGREWSTYRKQ